MNKCAMIGVLAILAGQAVGQCDLVKTRPNDANDNDQAGWAVGIQDNIMVIGTPLDDEKGTDAGAAHVMTRPYGSWKQVAKLVTKYGQPGDQFGSSIAFDGFYALVGAPAASPYGVSGAGSVTVFFHWDDAWFELTRLLISGYAMNDAAGTSVAMSGNWAVIGAPGDYTTNGNGSGSVSFVSFDQNGVFNVQPPQIPADGEWWAGFGQAVAMDGSWAAVGAYNANDGNVLGCGKVYLYKLVNGAWQSTGQKIQPVDRLAYDGFGSSVAICGDLMAVGAPGHDVDNWNVDTGAVYMYRRSGDTWMFDGEVDGREFIQDGFGCRVAIAGGRVFASTIYAGEVFAYEEVNGKWTKVDEITDPDGEYQGWFGSGLATDGQTLAIGDCLDDYTIISGVDNGAAYTQTIRPECTADFNSDGAADIFDFLAFQNAFVAQAPAADLDCNGIFDLFDFLAFQNHFVAGCV